MQILFSSSSEFMVVLRLLLLVVNLLALGSLFFRNTSFNYATRSVFGLGIGYLAVFAGGIVQQGAPGKFTQILLSVLLVLGWVSIVYRLTRINRAGLFKDPSAAIPFLLLISIAGIMAYSDWPRWIPLSSDPQQFAFFSRKVIDYKCIPWHLTEMGGLPFHYPGGMGVLGYLVFVLSGMLPAEGVSLNNAAFLLIYSLALAETAHRHRLPLVQRCLLVFVPFMIGVGGFYVWGAQPGNGRNISFWISQVWLLQLFLGKRPASSALPMLWGFALIVLVSASLNPTLAPFWAWIAVLTYLVLKREGGLTWRRGLMGFGFLATSFLLMFLADPFYYDLLIGKGIATPTFSHLARQSVGWHSFAEFQFLAHLGQHFQAVIQSGPRGWPGFLLLLGIVVAGNVKALPQVSRRSLFLWTGVALLPSIFIVVVSSLINIPTTSSASLILPYNRDLLVLTYWLTLFVVAAWSINTAADWLPGGRLRRVGFYLLAMGAMVGALRYGVAPQLERHSSVEGSPFPPVNPRLPIGLEDNVKAIRDLWRKEPNVKVLLTNREWTAAEPERWIMAEHYSTAIAYLPKANPAFFFYKGSPEYSYENYYSRVCFRWDPVWLATRGIHWVLLPVRDFIDPRCGALRSAASPGRYMLKRVADIPPQ